jgi:hypothetical protein
LELVQLRKSPTLERIRALLSERVCTVEELIREGIPKATAYYDVKRLVNNGEVVPLEGAHGRTRYCLVQGTILPDKGNFRLVAEKLGDRNQKVVEQAAADLEELSKHAVIEDKELIIQIAKNLDIKNPNPIFLQVLRHQSNLAKSKPGLQVYTRCVGPAARLVADRKQPVNVREDALAFLQIMGNETLPDLAFKVISEHDRALEGLATTSANKSPGDKQPTSKGPQGPTQFGIMIQGICVAFAKQEKWRRKLYDLISHNDSTIAERAESLLQQSRHAPIIPAQDNRVNRENQA